MKVYSVIFKEKGKSYYFSSEDDYNVNDKVIVETERGEQYARVNGVVKEFDQKKEYKNIIRIADDNDYNTYLELLKESDKALKSCKKIVADMDLNMNIVCSEYNFDKSQLLFSFTADDRVDFRDLAKKLASMYHTRIELRQIGARDKAKEVGGVGVCGRPLCCISFLNKMEAVSMNMAKTQNLALNPSKINGCCGRLLCCLQYEDEVYQDAQKDMPQLGSLYTVNGKKGKVVYVDVLNQKIKVLIDGVKEEIEFEK